MYILYHSKATGKDKAGKKIWTRIGAVRFVSHDGVLGDVGETWFRKDGHVFQLSVSAPDRAL